MTSRERVIATLNHKQPDRIPLDLGATTATGMAVNAVVKLREVLGLPKKPVKVKESYLMLGDIEDDIIKALGIDVVSPMGYGTRYGFKNDGWKPWKMHGDDVLVPALFNTDLNEDGSLYMYPKGNKNIKPSAKMPSDGWYFDAISRQQPIDDENLNVEDNLEEFSIMKDDVLRYNEEIIGNIYKNTEYAIVGSVGGTALGSTGAICAPQLENPKGIRDIEEWYISMITRKDYVKELFDRQTDIALENLKLFFGAVGNKIQIIMLCGADFGTQTGPFYPEDLFRELYVPYYKKMTDWIHQNTEWKIFKHSCGAIEPLIPSLIDAGFDIINPVQISANGMEPQKLKSKYGDKVTFCGGAVDTQHILPFGTKEEVIAQVKNNLDIFAKDGGYIFSPVHNIQGDTPMENLEGIIYNC